MITGYTVSPGYCILLGILRSARAVSPRGLAAYTPQLWGPVCGCCVEPHVLCWVTHCHDSSFLYMLWNLCMALVVQALAFWGQRACSHLPIPALHSTQWPLFAFGVGEQPLAWEEQSLEPVPANTKHAFLSLRDKLVCQQQEVMLLLSSPRGNSLWFPWGCMQLYNYRFI